MKKGSLSILIVVILFILSNSHSFSDNPPTGASSSSKAVRLSKFFQVDMTGKKIVGPASHVAGALMVNLVSVSVDQPQYWPDEAVRLKVLMPGRPGARFSAACQKRDANKMETKGNLDSQGVAVLTLLDGAKKRLELGEYRVDVRTEDGKGSGQATFSVVEGTLGAISLAYEFKQVTSVADLEKANGAWFMGNAAGAGKRWGNGLSFKNELRQANQPYTGEVKCISRCMLPGCNGVAAGPALTITAVKGKIEGTMNVGGHSGPFQIEFITPGGSIRHQFEGSSHVERDMMPASGGVTWLHRVGLAPYEKTEAVPGRQLFVEKKRAGDDPFEIDSIITREGLITLRIVQDIHSPALIIWSPGGDGRFEARSQDLGGIIKAGREFKVKIASPYSVVTMGGFVGGQLKEGWAIIFRPSELKVDLDIPPEGRPGRIIQVGIKATDEKGAGKTVSGILEVYDNRVASRSPMSGLASSLGDSVRNASRSVSSWQDRTGIDELAALSQRENVLRLEAAGGGKMMSKKAAAPASAPSRAFLGGRMGVSPGLPQEEEETKEIIREGERKVVFCDLVRTDASGRAQVEVTLPPQIGRVSMRFVAVGGLDHAAVTKGIDVSKKASVETSVPGTFVTGAALQVPVTITNTLPGTLTFNARGMGIEGSFRREVGPGTREVALPWSPLETGKVELELVDSKGQILDKREQTVRSVSAQPVTYSRLVVAGQEQIPVGTDETAMVYPGPGFLLKGIVTNMVTTMESWFGHAEALSAQAAGQAVILSALSRRLLDDEGLAPTIRVGLDKALRDLEEAFFDNQTSLVRPYPGLAPNPLWSAWVSRNLHKVIRSLKTDQALRLSMASAITRAEKMASRIDRALEKQGFVLEEQGYNADGREVIPVEIDSQVVYRVLTDDAVSRWVTDRLLPTIDFNQDNLELAFSRAYDTFRFLRAFQRVGALQVLTEAATALWLKGNKTHFEPLFARIARGLILAQEPGLVQGPALLGGIYSSPKAMIRFLELLVIMAEGKPGSGPVLVKTGQGTKEVSPGARIKGQPGLTVKVPSGAVVRIDRQGTVVLKGTPTGKALGKVEVKTRQLVVGGEAVMTVNLEPGLDPLEYYALVAVPTTTTIKQTGDILADYRGELIYGQQATGSSKMQIITLPFRGARTIKLLLEGAWPGNSPGVVMIRHIENPYDYGTFPIPSITVGRDKSYNPE